MRLLEFLGKLLNIRQGEWGRLSILYTMIVLAATGLNWADAIVQAAFLQRVGVQYLPWVIVSSAASSIGALFIYAAFADRLSNTRLLIAILVISGAGILLGLLALGAGVVLPAYLLLYLVLQVPLFDLFNVHWATYVNGFYDTRTAKRVVPVLGTSTRVAGIAAGLTMPLLNRVFDPSAILLITVASLAVMASLAATMPRLLHEQRTDCTRVWGRTPGGVNKHIGTSPAQDRVTASYAARLREGYQQVQGSPFLRWMALSTLAMSILLPLLNYGTSAIFQSQLQTTVAISNFVGVLTGIANLVLLPLQLLVLSRLIARLGLGNASLIYPFMSLITVGSLVVAPGLGTAALGYLDRVPLRQAFRLPTDNLLYNAVPQRVKARTRAFVGGLVMPIGAIAGGLLLLTPLMHTSWFLSASILVLVLAFVFAALMVRRYYGPALVSLLEQEDYSSLALRPLTEQEIATVPVDSATLQRLGQKLSESTQPERTLFMAQLISAVGGDSAVPSIGQAARTTGDSRLRASLVDVLVAAEVRSAEARELFVELLVDPDPRVRLSAVAGLEHISGQRDARYLEVAAGLLSGPDIEIRLRVLPALIAADDAGRRASAAAQLRALLNAPDPHIRARALHVVGRARGFGFLMELVRSLTDPVDEVRLAAALATETLSHDDARAGEREMLLALALLLLHDPIERARVAAITVLDQLSKDRGPSASAARGSLVAGLSDPSREVSEPAVEALVRHGSRVIPEVHEQLIAADPQLSKLPAVVLARIEPRKYAPLVLGANLDDTLRTLYQNLGWLHALHDCEGPAIALLTRALRERNGVLLDELLYLLSSVRDPVSIDTVVRSLRSVQPEVRANAVEALESLTAPQTAALIAPLLEPNCAPEPRLSLARQTWDIAIPTPVVALRLLLTEAPDSWLRTLAVAALAEVSSCGDPQSSAEITELLSQAQADGDEDVREEASAALAGSTPPTPVGKGRRMAQDDGQVSPVTKLVLLQPLPFFRNMTVEQLWDLARVCEQELLPAQTRLFQAGDPGGTLYVVVSGRVAIELEKRKDSFARLTTVEARSYLGESDFFDDNRRAHSAIAIQDTLALKLRREPVIALARQHPDLSLELINALSERLREANERIAALTRTEPDKLQRLYDQFEQAV